MKVDLDSDIKLILRFLPIPEIEILKQMTNELIIARDIVDYHKTSMCGVARGFLKCTCYGCHLLRRYEEAVDDV